jgi:Putative serine esterase (DUF676)
MSDHAVFLVHGLWGKKKHFWHVEEQLARAYPSLKIHSCSRNEGNKTYDGVDVGGDRIFAEVLLHQLLSITIDRGDASEMAGGRRRYHEIFHCWIFFGFIFFCDMSDFRWSYFPVRDRAIVRLRSIRQDATYQLYYLCHAAFGNPSYQAWIYT